MTNTIRQMAFIARRSMSILCLAVCIGGSVVAQTPTDSGGGPIRKKLIELGWGSLTPARLLEHQKLVEQTPFDGLALRIIGTDDAGNPVNAFQPGIAKPWKREWFQGEVDTLKKLKSTGCAADPMYCHTGGITR